ncbi:RrF2 family transcriptional regulator [Candidatus Latescibacterota bacterium]
MSRFFKISEATVLALHAMIYISNHPDRMVSTKEIAEFHHASEAHLSKVMQRLVRAGFTKSSRGPKGGFEVVKERGEISLLELYELFEGSPDFKKCLLGTKVCAENECIFGNLLNDLNSIVMNYMENTTLNDVKR